MAHPLVFGVASDLVERLELADPIVEFGSMQVEEGQPNDLRSLLAGRDFTGTDLRPGPGVDRLEDLRALSYPDDSVGTAISLDTLEHCADPVRAGRELSRVVRRTDGVCILSSVLLMGIHGYPSDYWRFTPEGLRLVLEGFEHVDVCGVGDRGMPFWVFGIARHGRPLEVSLADLPSVREAQQRYEASTGELRLGPFRYSLRALARELRHELPRVVRERVAARARR